MPTKKNLTAELPNDKTLIEGYALGVAVDKTGDTMTGDLTLNALLSGTAVTQTATDNTVGRVLKVGDFGVGSSDLPTITDLTVSLANGRYRYTDTSTTGAPEAVGYAHTVLVIKNSTGLYNFIAQRVASGGANQKQWLGVRTTETGAIVWREIYSQASILGTVSQSGGIPTGAIIERGSNSNGEYVKYADGTMICTYADSTPYLTTLSSGGIYYADVPQFTYPHAFSAIPVVMPTMNNVAIVTWVTLRPTIPTTTSCTIRVVSSSNTGSAEVSYTAIGRWY